MNLLESNGGRPNKEPKYTPIFMDRMFTGIWTNRSPLHDPSDVATARFYGGRPDALWQGSNVELFNQLWLGRRPGLTAFSTATYPTPPDRTFSFELTNGTIQVIVDTSESVFPVDQITVISGVAYYFFTSPQSVAASNAFVDYIFLIEGFGISSNNGSFVCTGSTSTYLVLTNIGAVTETGTAETGAITAGAVYYDTQGSFLASYGFVVIEDPVSDGTNFKTVGPFDSVEVVSSGLCQPSATSVDCGAYFSGFASPADQSSIIRIATFGSTAQAGPLVRVSGNSFYWLTLIGGAGTSQTHMLYAVVGGVQHLIGSFIATVELGDEWTLQVQGQTLTVYQNGNLMETVVDSVYSSSIASGSPGFFLEDSASITDSQISVWASSAPKELLFAKSSGAGQTGFVAVAGTLYMGDGVDTRKYTPLNSNGKIWNYSISAPTAQPSVTTVESGSAAPAWHASTFYSTMGLLVDSNGNIEFLTGVNNSGTNTTQFGTTGSGQPVWSNVTGVPPSSGEDGTCNWLCAGPLALWTPNTKFAEGACVYIPGIGGTPLPNFSQSAGNNTGRGINCAGTTGGGVWQAFPNGGTSSSVAPRWSPISDTHTTEVTGGLEWQYLGPAMLWQPLHIYNSWWEHLQMCVVEPTLPNAALIAAGTQQVFVQTNNNQSTGSTNVQGTSASGYTPPWPAAANTTPASVGQTTGDGDLQWICLGWGTWLANTAYVAWTAGATQFGAIKDGNGNFQVCIAGGLSGGVVPLNGWEPLTHYNLNAKIAVKSTAGWVEFNTTTAGTTASTEPTTWNFTTGATTTSGGATFTSLGVIPASTSVWGQTYGTQTVDGTVIWVNVGSAVDSTWVTDTQWYLPVSGFAAPTSSQAYGGAEVIANGDVQITISSGLSGSSMPAWGAIGTTTQDNQIVWYTDAALSPESLSWEDGYVYAYSYKARSLTDFYSTPSFVTTGPGQSTLMIPIPPGLNSALPPPSGSETGGISTASPVFTITGANVGAVNFVKVTGSLDPQVDTIVIWRSADGGGPSNMFELTEIPNPLPVNGAPGVAVFADFLPDVATTLSNGTIYPGLNELINAPIDDANDPPLSNFIPNVYNFERIWGFAGQQVLWSGGPDITNGSNANEAYNPSDNFPYLANVTRIIKNSQGLVVFITDSIEFIGGGPSTASFYPVTLAQGIGMNNFNGADIYAGEIIFFASDSELKSINPSLQLSNLGFPIGDQLALLNSSVTQVAYLQAGVDNAFYVADGSTGWWRANPHQIPGGANGPEVVWSPFANITNGAGMVQAVEISPGIKKLLVGSPMGGNQILERNLNVFTDNGTPYDAFFVMGSIMPAHPGQLALLKFIEGDFSGVEYEPTVSFLLNEISGTFVTMPNDFMVFDPPALYGTTLAPESYSPNRYFFSSTGKLARCRHLQVRVDFGMTPNPDAIYNLTLYGRLVVEL